MAANLLESVDETEPFSVMQMPTKKFVLILFLIFCYIFNSLTIQGRVLHLSLVCSADVCALFAVSAPLPYFAEYLIELYLCHSEGNRCFKIV